MSIAPSNFNPYQAPAANRLSASTICSKLSFEKPLPFEGRMPTEALAQVFSLRYREQVTLFLSLSVAGGAWGIWQLMQHPDHPLGYWAILISLLLGCLFAGWPLLSVWQYRRQLLKIDENVKGRLDYDGIHLAGVPVGNPTPMPERLISWSSLSHALFTTEHAVFFCNAADRTELLILSREMFQNSADWQSIHEQFDRAAQRDERPQRSLPRQLLRGVYGAIIIIAVFAILIAVALILRKS
jgi:hypothetical protein